MDCPVTLFLEEFQYGTAAITWWPDKLVRSKFESPALINLFVRVGQQGVAGRKDQLTNEQKK